MRKADIITRIAEKTGVPKVDVLVSMEAFFKEVKDALAEGENIYVRGFGSFIRKTRAAKIGRNIKKNIARRGKSGKRKAKSGKKIILFHG